MHLYEQSIHQYVRWVLFVSSAFVLLLVTYFYNVFCWKHIDCLIVHPLYTWSCGFVIKFGEQLALIISIRMTSLSKKNILALPSSAAVAAAVRPFPFQRVNTLRARVTLKTSEVGLFNYFVLMIKWEQHNGLINFLITVSTKSNYNQIHRLVNHTSIKLKQSPLGSNHFHTEQMSQLAQTSASGQGSVYLRTVTPSKGYSGWLKSSQHVRNLNRNCVCRIIMPACWLICLKRSLKHPAIFATDTWKLAKLEAAVKCQYLTMHELLSPLTSMTNNHTNRYSKCKSYYITTVCASCLSFLRCYCQVDSVTEAERCSRAG